MIVVVRRPFPSDKGFGPAASSVGPMSRCSATQGRTLRPPRVLACLRRHPSELVGQVHVIMDSCWCRRLPVLGAGLGRGPTRGRALRCPPTGERRGWLSAAPVPLHPTWRQPRPDSPQCKAPEHFGSCRNLLKRLLSHPPPTRWLYSFVVTTVPPQEDRRKHRLTASQRGWLPPLKPQALLLC